MRKLFTLLSLISFINSYSQNNIGIGTNNPAPSAMLDVESTTKGFLFPRMTTKQREAINDPALGLFVFDTDLKGPLYFDGGKWVTLNSNTPKDSGYVIIYTNTGMTDSINTFINDNYVGAISPGPFAFNGTPSFGQARTISIKWPVGKIFIKGSTSKLVNRSTSGTVNKNDTLKIKLDYEFVDPNAGSYYIEFLENGILKRFTNNIRKWQYFYYNYQELKGTNGCTVPLASRSYDGPQIRPEITSSPPSDIIIKFERANWKSSPMVGEYTIADDGYNQAFHSNYGNCQLIINGAEMSCDQSVIDQSEGSGAYITVTNVQIIEDLGLEKRGAYSGTFQGILYYYASFGSKPEKRRITNGKFFAPIGGISFAQ